MHRYSRHGPALVPLEKVEVQEIQPMFIGSRGPAYFSIQAMNTWLDAVVILYVRHTHSTFAQVYTLYGVRELIIPAVQRQTHLESVQPINDGSKVGDEQRNRDPAASGTSLDCYLNAFLKASQTNHTPIPQRTPTMQQSNMNTSRPVPASESGFPASENEDSVTTVMVDGTEDTPEKAKDLPDDTTLTGRDDTAWEEKDDRDPNEVGFDGENDPYDPLNQPIWRKWVSVFTVASGAICV